MRYFLHEPGAGIQLQWQRARRIHCHNQWLQQKVRQSEWLGLGNSRAKGSFFWAATGIGHGSAELHRPPLIIPVSYSSAYKDHQL